MNGVTILYRFVYSRKWIVIRSGTNDVDSRPTDQLRIIDRHRFHVDIGNDAALFIGRHQLRHP